MRLFPRLDSQVDVCAVRRAERAGALRHSVGLLVPNHGRGLRRGERAARDPCAGRGMQPEEPAPGFDRSGEGGAQGIKFRFLGNLFDSTIADEATWTLVGIFSKSINKMLCLLLQNPGFDFSGAEISGNYTKGGPDFSSLER
ncbi:hypothetical protein Chor_011929 [Crotalus horridus]